MLLNDYYKQDFETLKILEAPKIMFFKKNSYNTTNFHRESKITLIRQLLCVVKPFVLIAFKTILYFCTKYDHAFHF